MTVLTITLAGVKLLAGFTDTSQDAGLTALIALAQPALEYALDPAALANAVNDAGLLATLTLGVTEAIGGGYLQTLGRGLTTQGLQAAGALNAALTTLVADDDGATKFTAQTFKISTLEISTRPLFDNFRPEVTRAELVKLGADLAAAGAARLAPFARSAQSLARAAAGGDANLDAQTDAPLLLGAATPPDAVFDAVLGVDGGTEPTGGDVYGPGVPSPYFGFIDGR